MTVGGHLPVPGNSPREVVDKLCLTLGCRIFAAAGSKPHMYALHASTISPITPAPALSMPRVLAWWEPLLAVPGSLWAQPLAWISWPARFRRPSASGSDSVSRPLPPKTRHLASLWSSRLPWYAWISKSFDQQRPSVTPSCLDGGSRVAAVFVSVASVGCSWLCFVFGSRFVASR